MALTDDACMTGFSAEQVQRIGLGVAARLMRDGANVLLFGRTPARRASPSSAACRHAASR
ncbi:hypothetical protein D7V97_10910 [Corallococcus sp. CA053C]|nr:hypothetical protein D7V97_10910 [Corallococcus sp. CA053C]